MKLDKYLSQNEITQQQRETISHIQNEYGKKFTGKGSQEAYKFIKSVFPLYMEPGFGNLK